MSAPITITVSGPDSVDTLTVTQTIWQALNDACLEVEWPNGEPRFAITALYEQQTQLAMGGSRCMLRNEPSDASETIQTDSILTTRDRALAPKPNLRES
jgi:hypothetical protein